jgi:hypothetical protein
MRILLVVVFALQTSLPALQLVVAMSSHHACKQALQALWWSLAARNGKSSP